VRSFRGRRLVAAHLLVLTLLLCSAAGAEAPPGAPWLAYGRTPTVTNSAASPITVAQAKTFTRQWTAELGGNLMTAQPLYVPAVDVGGRTVPLVIAATGGNVVYALDARTGQTIWQRSLGPTVPYACSGRGGIEATPAIDAAASRIYVLGANGNVVALSLATGRPVPGWSVPVISRTFIEVSWGALRISGGELYVGVGSWCEHSDAQGAWNGRLVQISLAKHRIDRVFDVVRGRKNAGGGLWGPGGISIDPKDGSLWAATANSNVVKKGGVILESLPLAERVIHLSRSLKVLGSVLEPDSNRGELGDQGFGATPMLFQPPGCPPLLAVNSKNLYTYVWRRAALHAPPVLRRKLGAPADATFFAEPTWFPATNMLVVDGAAMSSGGNGVVGFHLSSKCTFTPAWETKIGGGSTEPQPLAVGPVAFASATSQAKLYAIDSANGQILATLGTGSPDYTAPMVAGDNVVVGNDDGELIAFGPSG
jgi:outer membrane protein assembly factor BamB